MGLTSRPRNFRFSFWPGWTERIRGTIDEASWKLTTETNIWDFFFIIYGSIGLLLNQSGQKMWYFSGSDFISQKDFNFSTMKHWETSWSWQNHQKTKNKDLRIH